jgi:hypothetical protein
VPEAKGFEGAALAMATPETVVVLSDEESPLGRGLTVPRGSVNG